MAMESSQSPITPQELLAQQASLRRLARRLLREPADVDDVLQEAWVVALENPPRHLGNVAAWLHRVTRNLALRRQRSTARRLRREVIVTRRPDTLAPDEAVATLERQRMVVDAVTALPAAQRELVVQHYFRLQSAAEIARREGVSRQAVSKRLRAALERLRTELDRTHEGDRMGWMRALLPMAGIREGLASSSGVTAIGGVLMGLKLTSGTLLAAVACFSLGFGTSHFLLGDGPDPAANGDDSRAQRLLERGDAMPVGDEAPRGRPPAHELATRASVATRPAAAPTADKPDNSSAAFLKEINSTEHAKQAQVVARRIAALPATEGHTIWKDIYEQIHDAQKRLYCLHAFTFPREHDHVIEILDRGVRDADAAVRSTALRLASSLAMRSFEEDFDAYRGWYARNRDRQIEDVIREAVDLYAARLRAMDDVALERQLRSPQFRLSLKMGRMRIDLRQALRNTGLVQYLFDRIPTGKSEQEMLLAQAIMSTIQAMQPPDEFIVDHILGFVQSPGRYPEGLFFTACHMVAGLKTQASLDAMLACYESTTRKSDLGVISHALATVGAIPAIPTMIAVIEMVGDAQVIRRVGSALARLTGVRSDPTHDSSWWRAWWTKHRGRFGDRDIPTLVLRVR